MYFYEILFPVQEVHSMLSLESVIEICFMETFISIREQYCFLEINIVLVTRISLIVFVNQYDFSFHVQIYYYYYHYHHNHHHSLLRDTECMTWWESINFSHTNRHTLLSYTEILMINQRILCSLSMLFFCFRSVKLCRFQHIRYYMKKCQFIHADKFSCQGCLCSRGEYASCWHNTNVRCQFCVYITVFTIPFKLKQQKFLLDLRFSLR